MLLTAHMYISGISLVELWSRPRSDILQGVERISDLMEDKSVV